MRIVWLAFAVCFLLCNTNLSGFSGANMPILKDNYKVYDQALVLLELDTFPGYRGRKVVENENEDFEASFDMIIIGAKEEPIPTEMNTTQQVTRLPIQPETPLEIVNECFK